ncbi:hypothetical protein U9M48_013635 [Paspalum notatum var. saurae]|uniref:Zinc finger MYM-type protein 1-like n=1 Tax=Paspalum notatum var. saurae TaxID=547442 RepID=A0AAQ3SZV1_PASNO
MPPPCPMLPTPEADLRACRPLRHDDPRHTRPSAFTAAPICAFIFSLLWIQLLGYMQDTLITFSTRITGSCTVVLRWAFLDGFKASVLFTKDIGLCHIAASGGKPNPWDMALATCGESSLESTLPATCREKGLVTAVADLLGCQNSARLSARPDTDREGATPTGDGAPSSLRGSAHLAIRWRPAPGDQAPAGQNHPSPSLDSYIMKRDWDIVSLFRKHAAKRLAVATSSVPPIPTTPIVEEKTQGQEEDTAVGEVENPTPTPTLAEDVLPPPPPPPPQPPVYDLNGLPQDPDKSLMKHESSKAHKEAQEMFLDYINPKVGIDDKIETISGKDLLLYRIRLRYSLRCLRFLLHQGLSFRGHDESEESSNRGNFIEFLKFLVVNSEEVDRYVLRHASERKIIEELGEEYYAILADESSDISHKEQLALCLRFVDRLGKPCEHFIEVVHVDDTTSLSLKKAIESKLDSHGLTMTQIRGQGYDGVSNMKGEIRGLKTLIMQISPSAYYIHCFAHQLQLVLVAVAKEIVIVSVSLLLNIVGVSCKRHDMLRNTRLENIMKAIDCGELQTGSGLNQEMGLPRPGETRWGSHYKTVSNLIAMYSTIHDVLISLGNDTSLKGDWPKIHSMVGAFESFDFVFSAHLMFIVLGYTNELSRCLQRREQDIINAISLVNVAKDRMQELRSSNGWDEFLRKFILFCNKYRVKVPLMEGTYAPYGRLARFVQNQTNDDHFRREVYIGVIDQTSQELDHRFDEIRRLAEFYPKEIFGSNLLKLELQLNNYIDDRFNGLQTLLDLSVKLVETKGDKVYDLVYMLLKMVLVPPVVTASVERAFSAMKLIKNKLRNKMGDDLLDDCLVTYIERDIFDELDEDDIMKTFMTIRKRRPKK